MSETDRPEPRDPGTAPAGVTDPLLWRLAAGVADAHQPDETGHCDNLLCGQQEWPCDAARQAQRALALSGDAPDLALSGDAPDEVADPVHDDRREESPGDLTALSHRRSRTAAEAA
ncbi:hypothetical protein [Micromonospora purpureochromogenes]|uniref:Uncharacterized protein n=1 Tax=Micromonospora purpureochromogenes TaxID=47872 RepID=A0ABX2RXJ2_9ACTN|nr:hypothetical protein [Micromonospora purpureochromogenes]NYF59816.1 hypothetical protein [Micromonospora purpureochromogenes]